VRYELFVRDRGHLAAVHVGFALENFLVAGPEWWIREGVEKVGEDA